MYTHISMQVPIPDWGTSSLFLVWPEGLHGRKHLVGACAQIASRIPDDIDLHIVIAGSAFRQNAENTLAEKRPAGTLHFHDLPTVTDIWIRDWAPVPVKKNDGSCVLVKAKYRPRYFKRRELVYAERDDRAGRELASILGLPIAELPLVWDIGNLTHNGAGTAIVSRRILTDNRNLFENEIRRLFENMLGIDRLLLVVEEHGDPTGHVDGTFRFLDEHTLAIASYPPECAEENRWCNERALELGVALGEDVRIVRIPNGPFDLSETESIPSAVNNYLNFLRIGGRMLMPQYGTRYDDAAVDAVRAACPGLEVIPVAGCGVSDVARLGGVLNCMSWAC